MAATHSATLETWMAHVGSDSAFAGSVRISHARAGDASVVSAKKQGTAIFAHLAADEPGRPASVLLHDATFCRSALSSVASDRVQARRR